MVLPLRSCQHANDDACGTTQIATSAAQRRSWNGVGRSSSCQYASDDACGTLSRASSAARHRSWHGAGQASRPHFVSIHRLLSARCAFFLTENKSISADLSQYITHMIIAQNMQIARRTAVNLSETMPVLKGCNVPINKHFPHDHTARHDTPTRYF